MNRVVRQFIMPLLLVAAYLLGSLSGAGGGLSGQESTASPVRTGSSVKGSPAAGAVQQIPNEVFVDGIVKSRRKYSFTILTADGEQLIKLDRLTQIHARLIRPKVDWKTHQATVTLPASAIDGNPSNNVTVDYRLPQRYFIRNRFENVGDRIAKTRTEPLILQDVLLTSEAVQSDLGNNPLQELTGELLPSTQPGFFAMKLDGKKRQVRVETRVLRVDGFSINDLEPATTEVFINGFQDGNAIRATHIEFMRIGDFLSREQADLPRCLVLGDTVSFNYLRSAKENLAGVAHVHHPPVNCGSSDNHVKAHRWLGLYGDPKREWDVIVFNFGHEDVEMTKSAYQENLRAWIRKLKPTGAALIWATTTPVPYGFNQPDLSESDTIPPADRLDYEFEELNPVGIVPGRCRLMNVWAEDVFREFPEVSVCDLWEVVDDKEDYQDWWFGKRLNFRYPETAPIGERLAKSIKKRLVDRP